MGPTNTQPAAPDPVATANAQTASNRATAITQQGLNSTNQVGPNGNLTYTQSGKWDDGTPQYTATTTLSPAQQQLLDQQTSLGSQANTIAGKQLGNVADTLSKPVDLSNSATEARLFDLGNQRLAPQMARDWSAQENTLMNRGIMPGSEQYTQAQDAFNRSKNDAYNQLALTGHGQSVQEALTARNQPINELGALMSHGQVSMPQFGSTPSSSVANTDVAGITNNAFANQMALYNANKSSSNAMMGGLFGLGGAALGGALGGPLGAGLGKSMGGWASGFMGGQ